VVGGCAALALGCAALVLCALLIGVADTGYWFYTQRTTGTTQESAADLIRAGLESLPAGNASSGEQVFRGVGACSACHSLDPDVRMISGPTLSGVASRAATVRPGYSAEMYIYESIVYPNAYVVEGFQGGIMPTGFKKQLSEQQLADLVAFLMTK
jgi:mono/diheme cytochrome c family protein